MTAQVVDRSLEIISSPILTFKKGKEDLKTESWFACFMMCDELLTVSDQLLLQSLNIYKMFSFVANKLLKKIPE